MPKWRKWKNWIRKEKKERKKEKRNYVFWNRTTSTDSIDLLCWNEYRVTLLSSPRWLNTLTGDETGLTSQLIQPLHYPTSPWKGVPHHRSLGPLLFTINSVGSFTCYKNLNSERAVRRGQRLIFRPYPRRLECLTICRQHILLSFFKDP